MNEQLHETAQNALKNKDGMALLNAAREALEQDENDCAAWLYLMRSFELILPVDQYDSNNEITAGMNAIECSSYPESTENEVYSFFLKKGIAVLMHVEDILKDCREIASEFQKKKYFDYETASEEIFASDRPMIEASHQAFTYVEELYDACSPQWLRTAHAQSLARDLANHFQKTYSFLEIRYEFYGKHMTNDAIKEGLRMYAHYLSYVEDRMEILKKNVPFNLYVWDQRAALLEQELKQKEDPSLS